MKSSALFIAFAWPVLAYAPEGVAPAAPEPAEGTEIQRLSKAALPVSSVTGAGRTGLSVTYADPAALEIFKGQAKAFVEFRRNKLPLEKKVDLLTECMFHPARNPFCRYLTDRWIDEPRTAGPVVREEPPETPEPEKRAMSVADIAAAIRRADFRAIKDVDSRWIYFSLRSISSWTDLERAAESALRKWVCPRVDLLTALGLKAEEFFPDPAYISKAEALYERADRCGSNDSEATAKARFRLALLHLWKGDCAKAGPLLSTLADQKDGNYISRGLYWTGRCAIERQDPRAYELAKERLGRVNPLGYHHLILSAADPSHVLDPVIAAKEPTLLVRSTARPDLNGIAEAAEVLSLIGAEEEARVFVEYLVDHVGEAEPGFQAYAAVLASRSGLRIDQFRLVAGAIRKDRTLLAEGMLRLYFPMERFELIWAQRESVDPYLVASLIRQESGFRSEARSPAGAIGLMQLMPYTARLLSRRVTNRDLLKPGVNVPLGSRYLRQQLDRYGGDAELALAAYNAGPANVDAWVKRYPVSDRTLFLDLIPFSETRNYVALISRNYFWYLTLYSHQNYNWKVPERGGRFPASGSPSLLPVPVPTPSLVFPAFRTL